MDIKKQFKFLVDEYGMKYSPQEFYDCFNGHWLVCTYSFYNLNGCFTIYSLPQRGEWDYYYSNTCSSDINELLYKSIDVYSFNEKLWNKARKSIFYSIKSEMKVLSELIKSQIEKSGEFFGIKVY